MSYCAPPRKRRELIDDYASGDCNFTPINKPRTQPDGSNYGALIECNANPQSRTLTAKHIVRAAQTSSQRKTANVLGGLPVTKPSKGTPDSIAPRRQFRYHPDQGLVPDDYYGDPALISIATGCGVDVLVGTADDCDKSNDSSSLYESLLDDQDMVSIFPTPPSEYDLDLVDEDFECLSHDSVASPAPPRNHAKPTNHIIIHSDIYTDTLRRPSTPNDDQQGHPQPQSTTPTTLTAKSLTRITYPTNALPNSPIRSLSAHTILRVCFRLGEAINVAARASRTNQPLLLELYARVQSSTRNSPPATIQHFVLVDMCHPHTGPYLEAAYVWCRGGRLGQQDAARFLGEKGKGRLCRCVGQVEVSGGRRVLRMDAVREAGLADVEYVRGIVFAA